MESKRGGDSTDRWGVVSFWDGWISAETRHHVHSLPCAALSTDSALQRKQRWVACKTLFSASSRPRRYAFRR